MKIPFIYSQNKNQFSPFISPMYIITNNPQLPNLNKTKTKKNLTHPYRKKYISLPNRPRRPLRPLRRKHRQSFSRRRQKSRRSRINSWSSSIEFLARSSSNTTTCSFYKDFRYSTSSRRERCDFYSGCLEDYECFFLIVVVVIEGGGGGAGSSRVFVNSRVLSYVGIILTCT